MSHETTGTFASLIAEKLKSLEERIAMLECKYTGCKYTEYMYVYKDAFGWHLTDDFKDIESGIGIEEWRKV